MLEYVGIDEKEFKSLWKKVLKYRNKFVAHLDSDEIMNVPLMENTYKTITFYYTQLRKYAKEEGYLNDLPADVETYYEKCHTDAVNQYAANKK